MFSAESASQDAVFNLQYADTVSPLSRAVIKGDLKVIRKLLSCGNSPQTADNRGWSSIHYAVASNQAEALKLILKLRCRSKKYLVNLTTFENLTPLFLAVKNQSSLEITKILLKADADPNLCDHTKLSPLHLACLKNGNIELVKLLVNHGADVNAVEELTNSTPLHFAVDEAKDLEVIEYLVKISDLTLKNSNNRTAFMESCCSNLFDVVKIFINFKKTLVNSEGYVPPLACAAYLGNFEMVQLFLKSGANVNLKCPAFVSDPAKESFGILLDVENYLPVHSSLTNIEIFKSLLVLTCPLEISKLKSNLCNFSLFVFIHSNSLDFYEVLLQSNFPESLKTFNSNNLVNLILTCSWEMPLINKKFKYLFKYNFNLEPDIIFSNLASNVKEENFNKFLTVLSCLAEMGISNKCHFSLKLKVIEFFKKLTKKRNNIDDYNLARCTIELLGSAVASLKQLSRLAVRQWILSFKKTNWLAFAAVKKLDLPESLIKYLYFE